MNGYRPVRRQAGSADDGSTQRRHRPDYILLMIAAALMGMGLIVVYSISPGLAAQRHVGENYFVVRQLIAIALGVVVFMVTSRLPLKAWRVLSMPLLITAGVATLIALMLPVDPNYPAHRWIRLGSLSFQSVELLKFSMIIWLSLFLSDKARKGQLAVTAHTLKPLLIILAVIGVLVGKFQSDLGSTGVIVAMTGIMGFVVGLPVKRILQIGGIVVIGLILLISSSAYRRDRVATFINPERDCQAAGYQACQALIAVGSGGVFGLGLGNSVQAYGYLPEAANDSIFAIFAEKFGFFGVSLILMLYVVLFSRLRRIIERSKDTFSRLVVTGILAWISTQAIINIGAMIGVLPLKGITLPFISYGGTSLMFVVAALGVAFEISRYTALKPVRIIEGEETRDNPTYGRGVRRAYYAAPGRR